jgi:hypothetical protein
VAAPPVERPEVRRYRFLLWATDAAVMERLHAEALARLDPLTRATILRTAQERLLSGRDLTVDDVRRLARLITIGERRTPGILVSAWPDMALGRLATIVVRLAEVQDLFTGYAAWDDGSDVPVGPVATDARTSKATLVQSTVAAGGSSS